MKNIANKSEFYEVVNMTKRELINKLLDGDMDEEVVVVARTDNGMVVVPVNRIYHSDDTCIEIIMTE